MNNAELINQSSLSEQNCTCGELYTNRKLVSPNCVPCNYREEVTSMLDKAREDEAVGFIWWINERGYLPALKGLWYKKFGTPQYECYTTKHLYQLFKQHSLTPKKG